MLNSRLPFRTAGKSGRGGFTLVELLVVIGIIAILAGVALGPISRGIKQAAHSSGLQTARTLALAEFQYANDNNQTYPFGTDAGAFATVLFAGGYISDPGIMTISGSSETKYTGTAAKTAFPAVNSSWNFGQQSTTSGLNANTPDQAPVVTSAGGGLALGSALATAGAVTTTLKQNNPFGTDGMAVCYHSNSAKFIISNTGGTAGVVQVEDGSWPGYTMSFALGNNG